VNEVTKEAFGLWYYNMFAEYFLTRALSARKPLRLHYLREELCPVTYLILIGFEKISLRWFNEE